jgi:cell division protein FtsI (penicillin-binding protein 3)
MTLGRTHKRLSAGFAAVCTLLIIVGGRLVQLQGIDHAKYAASADGQRVTTVDLHALRGEIIDRNGTVLAYTTDAQDITADPSQITAAERPAVSAKIASLLGIPELTVLKSLSVSGKYALIASAVAPELASKIADLNLHGIYSQATTQRQYPGGSTAANIVGLVHSDGTGGAGIESQYNSVLAGQDGSLTYALDGQGNVNPSGPNIRTNAINGGTVRLTIDQDLQYVVQQYLDSAVQQSGAKGAQAVVLDSHTGQVLALAANGTFNSADLSTVNADTPLNAPIQTVFEPGSANKVVVFSAAVQKGLITPTTQFLTPDSIDTGGVTVHDAWGHIPLPYTATGILAESSNVGTLEIANKVGPQTWDDFEKKFGIGQATGIELPGESAGILPDMSDWSESSFANLPIGQGEAMTVLQLGSMYQTIANNGVRIPPRIVQSVTNQDGTTAQTAQPAGIEAVTPQTAQTVRTMLESVTQDGGTGAKAALAGYRIAGKTGTAQQPDPAHGGAYSATMNWDTFAGIAPADDPKFVVAIMVDNPAHGLEGGDVAAPLYHEIASYEVQHADIAPTGSTTKHVPLINCTPDMVHIYTYQC